MYEKSQNEAIKNVDRKIAMEKFGPMVRFAPLAQWIAAIVVFFWFALFQGGGIEWSGWADFLATIAGSAFFGAIAHNLTGIGCKGILAKTRANQGE